MPGIAARTAQPLAGHNQPWHVLFGEGGTASGIPLGTAQWLPPDAAVARFGYAGSLVCGRSWIGEAFDDLSTPLGHADDRHVCLVSGSRGGKGVGVIVPNLCFWPGSTIVIDPKGENATVTAQRRGAGSAYAHAMGQKVCILDPFDEVALPNTLKAHYNPLDAIDPESDLAVDDAARVAASLIVIENRNEPYWEEAARNLVRGLILHVLSAPYLRQHRNLVTVRRLLTQGDWLRIERLRKAGDTVQPPFEQLWSSMQRNHAFNGVVAGIGEQMATMAAQADRQFSGVLEAARTNTEFLDSIPMQRVLEHSDFDLGELKTNPRGLSIYLTLPARYMETHYRWLRLMITLAIGEMERIKTRPASGHPTLFLLDEFAGLRRMEVIEHAAAQAAGFGVKFLFVVQNLAQLAELYDKSWETFFGNSGLKLFFQVDDDFTRSYLVRQLGELETTRQTHSGSQSQSVSDTTTVGDSRSDSTSRGASRRPLLHFRTSKQESAGITRSRSTSTARGQSTSTTDGWAEGVHKRPLLNPDEIGRMLARVDDRSRPAYPGLVLALVPGEHPLLARRVNYFESARFLGYFDPHPHHPPPPTLAELTARSATAEMIPLPPPRQRRAIAHAGWKVFWGGAGLFVIGAVVLAVLSHEPSSEPELASTAAPAVASSEPSPSYKAGVADWTALRIWFANQSGDRRAGADYWAANRNVRGHVSCARAAANYHGDQQIYAAGCQDAERILAPIDARRSDPEYRAGFNDEAKRSPL